MESTDRKAKRAKAVSLLLLISAAVVFASGLIVASKNVWIISTWPAAQGEVLTSRIKTSITSQLSGKWEHKYQVQFLFRYLVGGTPLQSWSTSEDLLADDRDIATRSKALIPGQKFPIHYNPKDNMSVSLVTWNFESFLQPILALLGSVALLFFSRFARKKLT